MIKINAQALCLICLQLPMAFSTSKSFGTQLNALDTHDTVPSVQRSRVQTPPIDIKNEPVITPQSPLSLSPLERLGSIRRLNISHSERQEAFIELASDTRVSPGFRRKVLEYIINEEKKKEILKKIEAAEMSSSSS
jgi:hypothetical protein